MPSNSSDSALIDTNSTHRKKRHSHSKSESGRHEKIQRSEKRKEGGHSRCESQEKRQRSTDRARGDVNEHRSRVSGSQLCDRVYSEHRSHRSQHSHKSAKSSEHSRASAEFDDARRAGAGRKQRRSSPSSPYSSARSRRRSRSPVKLKQERRSNGKHARRNRSPDGADRNRESVDRRPVDDNHQSGRWADDGSVSPCDLTRVKQEPAEVVRPDHRRHRAHTDGQRRLGGGGASTVATARADNENSRRHPAESMVNTGADTETANNKLQPDFALSGMLTADTNTCNGVVVKYSEPPEARTPRRRWRLYVFKGESDLPTLHIHRQSGYLIGRDRKVADIPVDHPSCSKQHAALQFRLTAVARDISVNGSGRSVRPYIMDLQSANGTFVNNRRIEAQRYVELFERDVLKFGFSSREYVLLHEHSKDDDPGEEDDAD